MLRAQWRRFRARFAELKRAPILRYRDVAAAAGAGDIVVGRFRLYGRVEALEGSDRVWLRGQGVTALVDLRDSPLYALTDVEDGSPAGVVRLSWKTVPALAAGTSMLAAGFLVLEEGKPVFIDAPGESLIALSYDCEDEALVSAIVSGSRAANEYWTPLSQVSLAIGVAVESVLLVFLAGRTPFSTVRAMSFLVGVSPVLLFAPPGLFFFLLYRSLWRRALSLRVQRDLLRMPLDYFPEIDPGGAEIALSDGGRYIARALAKGESAPAGALALEASKGASRASESWLFYAEGSSDPALETILSPGDPAALASAASRNATFYAMSAGIAVALGLVINFAFGIVAWQRLF